MQLKRKVSVAEALAVASCSLLTSTAENSYALEEDIDIDLSYLEYREVDRVRVREVDISAKWVYDEDNIYYGKVITDAMTGATPSGAVKPPGPKEDTLTSPSGVSGASGTGGSSAAVIRPLEGFVDRRVAIGGTWERSYNRTYRTKVGGTFSTEDDYKSYSGSGSFAYDLNQKLTTLEAGLGYAYDFVGSVVGIYKEYGNLADDKPNVYKDGEKETIDWALSATQVLTRGSIVKLGFITGSVEGYLSDPYKVVTLIDKVKREPDRYFHEKRPGYRSRHSLNVDYNQAREDNDVVSAYYRYYWDDWGIKSHTLDVRFRHELEGTHYIQPHIRIYRQSAADFYYPFLDEKDSQDPEVLDSSAPAYVSADNRLDEMLSYTVGAKYGMSGSLGKFFGRFEIMRQLGDKGDYRKLTAAIIQAVWTLDFKK